jgi:hypothetical protein
MTIFAASSNARTFDYQAGDIGYVPASFGTSFSVIPPLARTYTADVGHYIENTGNTTLHFLEIFNTGEVFDDVPTSYYSCLSLNWASQIVSRI